MGTLIDLAKRMRKLKKNVEKSASKRAVNIATAILDELTLETPVDTSKAVSNWQVGLGSPVDVELEAHVEGILGTTGAQSASITRESGKSILAKKKPGVPIYISNTTSYVRELNEGKYNNFVERAVFSGKLKAKKVNSG